MLTPYVPLLLTCSRSLSCEKQYFVDVVLTGTHENMACCRKYIPTNLFLEAHEVSVQTTHVTVNRSVRARDVQSVVVEASAGHRQ